LKKIGITIFIVLSLFSIYLISSKKGKEPIDQVKYSHGDISKNNNENEKEGPNVTKYKDGYYDFICASELSSRCQFQTGWATRIGTLFNDQDSCDEAARKACVTNKIGILLNATPGITDPYAADWSNMRR